MTAQDETEVNDYVSMGGSANLFTITEKSGMGVLTGTIDGAAYGEPTSALKDLGNGDFEFTMMHYFLDKDGSTLHAHDKAVMHPDRKGEGSTLEVEYTVVQASGGSRVMAARSGVAAGSRRSTARARRASIVLVLFVSKVRSVANRRSTST